MMTGKGKPEGSLTDNAIRHIVASGTPEEIYRDKRVLVLTPDNTRTCPLPLMISVVHELMAPMAKQLDFMVALGTHQPLSEERILQLYGISQEERKTIFKNSVFHNHRWDLEGTFTRLGYLDKDVTREVSGGRLVEIVPVDINKTLLDYDQIVILGPVFPA